MRPLPPQELEALVHLRLLPRLSDRRLRALLKEHRSARAVLQLDAQGLGEGASAARRDPRVLERLRRSLQEIERSGAQVLVVGRAGYPKRLLHLTDPPCVLFARGRLELLSEPAVAVVGSRRHTEYGAGAAERIARELADAGLVVVSGLARGIDGIAHRAALGRGTIAVLGSGIDVPYPSENSRLFERIAEQGLLVSEFPPGTPPLRQHFPQRNRVIAALARGVVVVEAGGDSGSLITARDALDMGRDVFAVPGPIGRDTSAGTNQLIQEGATLVTSAADVLEGLAGGGPIRPRRPRSAGKGGRRRAVRGSAAAGQLELAGQPDVRRPRLVPDSLDGDTAALFAELSAAPRHIDELASACSVAASTALAELLTLELLGHARQLSGARFVRA